MSGIAPRHRGLFPRLPGDGSGRSARMDGSRSMAAFALAALYVTSLLTGAPPHRGCMLWRRYVCSDPEFGLCTTWLVMRDGAAMGGGCSRWYPNRYVNFAVYYVVLAGMFDCRRVMRRYELAVRGFWIYAGAGLNETPVAGGGCPLTSVAVILVIGLAIPGVAPARCDGRSQSACVQWRSVCCCLSAVALCAPVWQFYEPKMAQLGGWCPYS